MDLSLLLSGMQIFILAFIPALMGMICHEVAHGWVAWRLGDPTAKMMGRLTLNPIKHIDPMGLGMFIFTAIFTRFIFGWAKPVPVQSGYFSNPRSGMMLVAAAGPMTNFVLALLCAFLFRITIGLVPYGATPSVIQEIIISTCFYGVWVNCVLAVFNLIPVPPLDGSHIISGLMPEKMARIYWGLGRYSMLLVIVLLASGMLGRIFIPIVEQCTKVICLIAGVDPRYFL